MFLNVLSIQCRTKHERFGVHENSRVYGKSVKDPSLQDFTKTCTATAVKLGRYSIARIKNSCILAEKQL